MNNYCIEEKKLFNCTYAAL